MYNRDKYLDYSTIDLEVLRSLPVYKRAPTYRIDNSPGAACYGDPPGYPTYFLRYVWTPYGNHPRGGAVLVISDPERIGAYGEPVQYAVVKGYDDYLNDWTKKPIFRKLWKPVPMDSLRFKLWERGRYIHFSSCIHDESVGKINGYARCGVDFRVSVFAVREYETYANYEGNEQTALVRKKLYCDAKQHLQNHAAVYDIREFYPEYQVNVEWAVYRPTKEQTGPLGGRLLTLQDGFMWKGKWIDCRHGEPHYEDWWEVSGSPILEGVK